MIGLVAVRVSRNDPGLIAPVAAGLTLVIGMMAVFRSMEDLSAGRAIAIPVGLVALGALVELVGVRTGWPFGHYSYTANWRPIVQLPEEQPFPVLVPVAWALVVGAATSTVLRIRNRAWPAWSYALLSGGLAAMVDLVMEPVMTGPLAYWRWNIPGPLPGGAPWTNLVGWFAVGALGAAYLLAVGGRTAFRRIDASVVLGAHLALLAVVYTTR